MINYELIIAQNKWIYHVYLLNQGLVYSSSFLIYKFFLILLLIITIIK
jgi:hypothetical protein